MTSYQKRWLRLDNAAKLYPAVQTKKWSNVFRLSITLQEKIDVEILQSALDITIKRFPSIAMKLCKGFFWYYLEEIESVPKILPERAFPCSRMTLSDIKTCAFRIMYYENRIAAEFFHALTDGNGGLVFLKTLAAEYISQKNHVQITSDSGVLDRHEIPNKKELEDSFLKNDGNVSISRKETNSYKIHGTKENDGFLHITTGIINLNEALLAAKEHKVSLTAFLVAVMIFSVMEIQNRETPIQKNQKPIKILIPVNLRNYFDSITLRNFVLYITPGIEPNTGTFTFEEIVHSVHHQMKLLLTQKQMQMRITTNVKAEKNSFLKVMPLMLKNIGMKSMFSLLGEKKSCLTMSNLGSVTLPEEMEPYVKRFDFSLGVQSKGSNNCGILSYKDKLYINMIRNIKESELERLFFTKLVDMGIPVTIESNQGGI